MRNLLICSFAGIAAAALLLACNSQEGAVSKLPSLGQKSATPVPQQVHNPADDARRITAEELYKMYEEKKVLIVDTRNEAVFKQSHIKGAILIPFNEIGTRLGELPKDKFIATYCT
jgi:3-mercaptopyruvate sulfurtransferase SseA